MHKLAHLFLYFTVFITGAAVLVVEILGTRILAPFYGSTIFVWSSLISVTLGFLSLGYWLGGKLSDKDPSFFNFYLIIFLSGVSISVFLQFKKFIILFADNFGLQYGPLVASTLLFGITFFLFGMVSPFAIRLLTNLLQIVGSRSGSVFAFSTIGSLFGAILSGFVLIPIFSISTIFYTTSIILIILSILGWALFARQSIISRKLIATIFISLFFLAAGFFLKNSDIFQLTFSQNGVFISETIFEENNFYGYNKLIGQPRVSDGKICFLIDGTLQGCIDKNAKEEADFIPIAAVVNSYPRQHELRFLMLGFGVGEYFYYYPPKGIIDIVDINPSSFKAFFAANKTLLNLGDKGFGSLSFNRHQEDARNFLRKSNKKYDVIFTDLLSNVVFPEYVFTREAFLLAKESLTKDGSFIISIIGKTDGEDKVVNSILATAQDVFPYIYLYSEKPENFFQYNIIVARKMPMNLVEVNKNLHVHFREITTDIPGFIITDNFNPLWIWWTENIKSNINSPKDLRLKFKRLTADDFN